MTDELISQELLDDLYGVAKETREKAYAPYSKYQVGAALKLKGCKQLIAGCNVENSSFGATVCAERTAILQSVALHGGGTEKIEIEVMVLITDNKEPAAPCGVCLQVMSEFCQANTPIYLSNLQGIQKKMVFSELFPNVFEASKLP